ncbi:MAG: glycerol-3-phosphate dehydrogenase subunit GlpB [Propionibacteriaceae bacterium]|jgi:glycerol-3-phosphate dehydrogenase subunit B|nr:glycerol-3-phosphate dehydrogenase subunit GlpB [Propionibacteriaceae bacterium]
MTDTIIVGAGLSGLSAAIRLAQAGAKVTLFTFGLGGIQLGQGTIDVLGYSLAGSRPTPADTAITDPFAAMSQHLTGHPGHPYATVPLASIRDSVDWLAALVPDLLTPGDGVNHMVPTALGGLRPTYLIQPSMTWSNPSSIAVVSPRQIKDFYPRLAAANLTKTAHVDAHGYHIDLPARPGEVDSSPVAYATALDRSDFARRFVELVANAIADEEVIGLPAILGLHPDTAESIARALGRPVVEFLLPPPSVPGMRLNVALTQRAKDLGVRVVIGSKVTGFTSAGAKVTGVVVAQAGRDQTYPCDHVVYAPGGFESGALTMDSYGGVRETLFDLPVVGATAEDLITGDYWADQRLFACGVAVDSAMTPLDVLGQPIYTNLHAVGGLLAGAVRWTEKSGDGIAITSAVRAADAIVSPGVTPTTNERTR